MPVTKTLKCTSLNKYDFFSNKDGFMYTLDTPVVKKTVMTISNGEVGGINERSGCVSRGAVGLVSNKRVLIGSIRVYHLGGCLSNKSSKG